MGLLGEDEFDERRRVAPDLAGLPPQALRRPVRVALVARRHVLAHRRVLAVRGRPQVRGDALAVMEQLDRARGDARPQLLSQQLMRHRVVVLLDLHVIVEASPAFLPLRERVGFGRQRLESRTLDLVEQRASAGSQMPRHALV